MVFAMSTTHARRTKPSLAKHGTLVVGKAASIMRSVVQITFLRATVEVQKSSNSPEGRSAADIACVLKDQKNMTNNFIYILYI